LDNSNFKNLTVLDFFWLILVAKLTQINQDITKVSPEAFQKKEKENKKYFY
jgi:hypothetical protein